MILQTADRLVVSATADELDDLARSEEYLVGLQNVGRPIRLSDSARSDDVKLIGLTIGPAHPALGRELRDIPFLSNLPARILGIGRARHLPGPRSGKRAFARGGQFTGGGRWHGPCRIARQHEPDC